MTTGRHNDFNAWLDAARGGPSTPPSPASADPDLRDAQRAASQLHDLARHAERPPADPSLPASWEEFMSTHNIAMPPPSPAITGVTARNASRSNVPRPAPPAHRPHINWNAIASFTLVAFIVATIGVGGWRVYGEIGGSGGPSEPAHTPLGGFVQDDGTPEPEPLGATIATAEECTIEPLTIDQVVQIVYDPHAGTPGPALYQELGEYPSPAYASDEAVAGATSTFHMFEACIEANSYFQVWALVTPVLLQESILAVLPPLTGEEELRQILADLEANGPDDPYSEGAVFWNLTAMWFNGSSVDSGRVSRVVNQNIENTWMPTETFLVTGYDSFYSDGSPTEMDTTSIYDSELDGTPEPVVGYDPRMKQPSCFSIIFSWSESREMWLIQSPPVCG